MDTIDKTTKPNGHGEFSDPHQEMQNSIERLEGAGGDSDVARCYRQQWQQYTAGLAMKQFSLSPEGTAEFYNSVDRDRAELLAIRKRCASTDE